MKHDLKPQPRRCGYCGEVIIGKVYLLMPGGHIHLCHVCRAMVDAILNSQTIGKEQPRK